MVKYYVRRSFDDLQRSISSFVLRCDECVCRQDAAAALALEAEMMEACFVLQLHCTAVQLTNFFPSPAFFSSNPSRRERACLQETGEANIPLCFHSPLLMHTVTRPLLA